MAFLDRVVKYFLLASYSHFRLVFVPCALFPGSCYASKAGDFKDRLSIEGSMDVTCVVVVSLDFCKSFFLLCLMRSLSLMQDTSGHINSHDN